MTPVNSSVYLVLALVGLGVLSLVMLFALRSMLKLTRTCLVLGVLGIFLLLGAALLVFWVLMR